MSEETNPWRPLSFSVPYDNPWIRVEDHQMLDPTGKPAQYGIVRVKRLAVGVLPIAPDGRVHLVGQWRVPLDAYSWEMPEGGAEPGEAAEACARRELEEEAGLKAGRLQEILQMELSNSVTDERAILFLATDLSAGAYAPEDTEVLAHRIVPFRTLLLDCMAGRVRDSMTVAAALGAYYMAKEGLLDPPLAQAMLAARGLGA